MAFTASTKCQCLPSDFVQPGKGCKGPDACGGPGSAGVGDYCEKCTYFKQLSNETGLFIATQRTVVRPPATQPNPPVPPLAQSYAEQSSELYHNPGSHSYPPIAPSQSRAEQSSEPYGNPGSHSYPPIAPAHTGSYAEPSGEPYRDPANHSYPSPATVTTPAEANYLQAANTSSPSLASSSPAAELLTHPPCACQLGWPCNAGGLCEETIFLEGDWCGMCTLLDCNQ
ncbi:uncharacterized protein B0H64DRAFT_453050 [Chaetomium fimeti]|uniref:Uncharacterized protein n=1 Tax=Chaetomium fimeti TaxID=1854472 RepID=A0AAE0H531_9PEZI|nr:hypothetical protein B0H64DRAFT_453050 [Chaetomium fimeti]